MRPFIIFEATETHVVLISADRPAIKKSNKMVNIWVGVWSLVYWSIALTNIVSAGDSDHVHIKLHLPELLKKHTHVKTVYKHHYHPKKTILGHSHALKGSLGSHIELDTSFSMLNPTFALAKPATFQSLELPEDTWLPEQNIEDVMSVNNIITPKFSALDMNNNQDIKETFSKYLLAQKQMQPHFQKETNQDYTNYQLKGGMKNYEDDDEDEEYTMTEESLHEQPFALQMHLKSPIKYGLERVRHKNTGLWNHPDVTQASFPSEIIRWNQPSHLENYFTRPNLDSMQRMKPYKNIRQLQDESLMQLEGQNLLQPHQSFDHQGAAAVTLKSAKSASQSSKGGVKKRKVLAINRSANNGFMNVYQ